MELHGNSRNRHAAGGAAPRAWGLRQSRPAVTLLRAERILIMTRIAAPAHTILIVEDDDDSRTLLGHLLSGQGYAVVMARNGLEGLQVARSTRPTLILLDVQMPIMDGVAFRQHQIEDPEIADIPVVCVSALDVAAMHARELHGVQFVRKPIDFDRLLRIISDAATAPASEKAAGPRRLTVVGSGRRQPVAAVRGSSRR